MLDNGSRSLGQADAGKDEQATKQIKEGYKDSSGKERMKAFADKLSDDEVKALVAYVRSLSK